MSNRVLIIDDDEEMCMELKEILAREGYEVRVAMDGRAGKDLMECQEHDVVILDLKLPKLDGYGVLKAMKRTPRGPKIIVLSGRPLRNTALIERGIQNEEEKALQMADVILNKPVLIPVLLGKVKQYLTGGPGK